MFRMQSSFKGNGAKMIDYNAYSLKVDLVKKNTNKCCDTAPSVTYDSKGTFRIKCYKCNRTFKSMNHKEAIKGWNR